VIRTLGARHAGTKTKASSTRLSSLAKRRCASRSRFWAKSTPTLRRATTTSVSCEWLVHIVVLFGLTVYLLFLCMQTRVRDACLFRHAACAHHALFVYLCTTRMRPLMLECSLSRSPTCMRGCYNSFRVGCLHALVLICTVVARARTIPACAFFLEWRWVGADVDILV
jgi:hypothetical protein